MTKSEKLHILIKEIKELEVLVRGMDQMAEIPTIVRDLAVVQARNIFDGLSHLNDVEAPLLKTQLALIEDLADKGAVAQQPDTRPMPAEADRPVHPETAVTEAKQEAQVVAEEPREQVSEEKKSEEMTEQDVVQVIDNKDKEEQVNEEVLKKAELPSEKGTDIATNKVREAQDRGVAGDRFRTGVRSLNETILSRKPETRFVVSLKKAINLNDRFRYQRELFSNDPSAMNAAIEQLDAMATLAEAMEYVSSLGWSGEAEAEADFLALLEARFSHTN